jgi:flagellin-like hook-associated protein FlgL
MKKFEVVIKTFAVAICISCFGNFHASAEPNPAVAKIKHELSKIDAYKANVDLAHRDLTAGEEALSSAVDKLLRAREIAIVAANSSLTDEEKIKLANEIQQLQQTLLSISNTQIADEYIFSGSKTKEQPFTLESTQPYANPVASFHGDLYPKKLVIGHRSDLAPRISGGLLFLGDGYPPDQNLFQMMANLEVALRAGDLKMLKEIMNASNWIIDGVNFVRSDFGARTSVTERVDNELDAQRDFLTDILNDIQ